MRPKETWSAIVMVLGAVFLFSCQDTISKYLFSNGNSVPFVQAIRFSVNLILVSALFLPRQGWQLVKTGRPVFLFARALNLVVGALTAGFALRLMPLAELTGIVYLYPLGILLLAWPLLGERTRWFDWVASGFGFTGLLLIVRPGTELSPTGLVFVGLNLITAITYPIMSRILSKTESTETMMFYVGLTGTAVYAAQLPWTAPAQFPPLFDFTLMVMIGFVSLLAHFLFTAAYARAPVSLLAPFTYAQMAWATLLGWAFFNKIPDFVTFIGIAFVAAAGVGNAVMNHRFGRKTGMPAEPAEV